MYIGSLKSPDAHLHITYAYRTRGGSGETYPDLMQEEEKKDFYDCTGKLMSATVGFNGNNLLDDSIDIELTFSQDAYVDHIRFTQEPKSAIGRVQAFIRGESGGLKAVGNHAPESGKTIREQEIEVTVGVTTDHVILRLEGAFRHIIIGDLDVVGAVDMDRMIYPIPQSMQEKPGFLTVITGISASSPEEVRAKENFIEKYQENLGRAIPEGEGNVIFRLVDDEEEAFAISVDENRAEVTGGSLRALLYASEKLLQLCTPDGIRQAEIHDKPFLGLRGVHFALPSKGEIPFLKRLVKYLLMPLGYNTVFLEIAAGMEYACYPKINEAWTAACEAYERGEKPRPAHYGYSGNHPLTHDEVREICAYMRSYGLKIIPEVQSFGHVQYITTAYPELGEWKPGKGPAFGLPAGDSVPDDYYAHCMCPEHPDYYKVIFAVMDEVIEVVEPDEYVHIGHDEIHTIGKCERCRHIPEEDLYVKEVTALHDHLAERGYKTMMWSDMIQEPIYQAFHAIDRLPKDIVCLSFTWYFHLETDVEERLYDRGFPVVIGNFYSSHYPRYDTRKHGRHLLGAEVSCWCSFDRYTHAYAGKTYDMMVSANAFWNEGYTQTLERTYRELANRVSSGVLRGLRMPAVSADAREIPIDRCPEAVPHDIREDYAGALRVSHREEKTVAWSGHAARLSFLHATDKRGRHIMRTPAFKSGEYVIIYEDGTRETAEILYGANICEYRREYALPKASDLFRHVGYMATCLCTPVRGKTADGEDYTLYDYTWENPHPEKRIESIILRQCAETDESILLFGVRYE